MLDQFVDDVYMTLQGELISTAAVPGVENLFEEGKACFVYYENVLCAYARLCARLGADEEDSDVEEIIHNLMLITDILAKRMFEYGAQFCSGSL